MRSQIVLSQVQGALRTPHIFAARRSYSFWNGNCHRIWIGRTGRRKRFKGQLINSKTVRDRPYVSMCQWGANGNHELAIECAYPRPPRALPLQLPKAGYHKVPL